MNDRNAGYRYKTRNNRGEGMTGLLVGIVLSAIVIGMIGHFMNDSAKMQKIADRRALATTLQSLGILYINSPKFLATLRDDMSLRFSAPDQQLRLRNCLNGQGNPLPAKSCDEEFGETMQVLDGFTQLFANSGESCALPTDPTVEIIATNNCPVLREVEFKLECPSALKCDRYAATVATSIYLNELKTENTTSKYSFSLSATGQEVESLTMCSPQPDGTPRILVGQETIGVSDQAKTEMKCEVFKVTHCPANSKNCLETHDVPYSPTGYSSLSFNGYRVKSNLVRANASTTEFCGPGQTPYPTDILFLVDVSDFIINSQNGGDTAARTHLQNLIKDFKLGHPYMVTSTPGKLAPTTAKVVTFSTVQTGSTTIKTSAPINLDTSSTFTLPSANGSSIADVTQFIDTAVPADLQSSNNFFPVSKIAGDNSRGERSRIIVIISNAQQTVGADTTLSIGGIPNTTWASAFENADLKNTTVMVASVGAKSTSAFSKIVLDPDDLIGIQNYEALASSGEAFRQLSCSEMDEENAISAQIAEVAPASNGP